MVAMRSRSLAMIRVARIPGMAQANELVRGTKLLPVSPTRVSTRSSRKAARAM